MSFFENPFAEEEAEEVIPEEPFGDYDEEKRENDYNALVIRARVLDAQLEKKLAQNQLELDECIHKNAHLRHSFEEQRHAWGADVDATRTEHNVSSAGLNVLPSVYHESDEAASLLLRKRNAIRLYQAKLASSLSDFKEKNTRNTVAAPTSFLSSATDDVKESLTESIRAALSEPDALGDSGSSEEYQLLAVLCGHLYDALRSYASLTEEVQRMENAMKKKLAEWEKAQRLLGLCHSEGTSEDKPEGVTETSRLLGVANSLLQSRIDQIQRMLALYDGKGALELRSDAKAVWPNIAAAKLTSQIRFFSAHANHLAKEVVSLRALLRNNLLWHKSADEDGPRPPASSLSPTAEEANRVTEVHKYHRSLRHRVEALRDLCLRHEGNELAGEPMVIRSFLDKFVDVQDAFLHSMAILNSHFKKQATSAVYMQRILLHDAEMDANTFSRALDIQRDGLAIQSEVLSRLSAPENGPLLDSTEVVANDEACNASLEFSRRACELVKQEVRQFVADVLPPQTDSLFNATPCPTFCIQEDGPGASEALQAEIESARVYNTDFLDECKKVLTQRYNELEKKLTWLERQRYAKPLVELYAVHKEIDQLQARTSNDFTEQAPPSWTSCDVEAIRTEIAEEEAAIKEMGDAFASVDAVLVSLS